MFIPSQSREELTEFLAYNLLTPSEAAELLGISKASMSNLKHRGTIQPAKVTEKGQVLYLRSDIMQYKMRREKENSTAPLLYYRNNLYYGAEQASIRALAIQGRIAVFPARLGATVYCISIVDGAITPGVVEMYTNLDADGNGDMVIRLGDDVPDIVSITCGWHEVGKTVFLTEEQARTQLLKDAAITQLTNKEESKT